MIIGQSSARTLEWKWSWLWLLIGVAAFQIAYSGRFSGAGFCMLGYALALVQLTNQPTVRRAFYLGLATGFLGVAPQLLFFWKIFGVAAPVLWLVLAFWIGLFVAIGCGCRRRWGDMHSLWLLPVIWTGLEYFRSELYYLKFSWLNIGYAVPWSLGIYGTGFLFFALVVFLAYARLVKVKSIGGILLLVLVVGLAKYLWVSSVAGTFRPRVVPVTITGIQMEFPSAGILPKALDKAFHANTNAQIFVLSEYTLEAGPPEALKDWCRQHARYLVVGGKDVVTNDIYYNTAFVVDPNGDIVFKQAKSVPIQFFHDGLPAPRQQVWDSPWGKIGICICYDLSYTRVTDELVRQGAQLLIVPTMDVSEWGRHEHELHALVAPRRAAEYGLPIFRLASSGISQAVDRAGAVVGRTSFDNAAEILSANLFLPEHGSLPLDRQLAPLCTLLTGSITAALIFLAWREKIRTRGRIGEGSAGDGGKTGPVSRQAP